MLYWKRWGLIGITWILCLIVQRPIVFAVESIPQFASEIAVQKNGSIHIQETIQYTTDTPKHGLIRYIPIRYQRGQWSYTTPITQMSVTDQNNQNIPFEQSSDSGNIVLKIGDPESTFTGEKTYVLRYQVGSAVQLLEPEEGSTQPATAELYWDITGEGWSIPIASAQAQVRIAHQGGSLQRVACYGGEVEDDDGTCITQQLDATTAEFIYPATIQFGENFTIAAELDPSAMQLPTRAQQQLKRLLDNALALPLLLPGIIMAVVWWKRGRDWSFVSWNVFHNDPTQPQQRRPFWSVRKVPFVYEPIAELTPGQAGALMDERIDTSDVVAEIIDLARQKYLTIERTETKKFLHTVTDYVFTRQKSDFSKLPEHQAYLMQHLFGSEKTAHLSKLKGTFATHFQKTQQLMMQSLHQKKLVTESIGTTHAWSFGLAIAMLAVAGVWMIHLLTLEIWWSILCFAVSAVASLILAYQMPAKTAVGYNLALQARGLQKSIQRGAWREKIKEQHLFIEEVLPFAVALGVVKQLTKDMDDLQIEPPSYLSSSALHGWSTATFVQSFSQEAASALSYHPNSSSWSSGSGFSGGFSGGGGGGGGGSSW